MAKGWKSYPHPAMPGLTVYEKGSLRCIVGKPDGFWHLSITAKKRWPAYAEMKEARYDLIPHDCNMAMIFPRPEEFINAHTGCFHLHELRPGEVPAPVIPFMNALGLATAAVGAYIKGQNTTEGIQLAVEAVQRVRLGADSPRLRQVRREDMEGKPYRHFLIAGEEDNSPYRPGDVLKIGDNHYEIVE